MKANHEGIVGSDGKVCDSLSCWCRPAPVLVTSNVVAADEAAFEVWFQQHRRETWTKSRPGERGPEPSAAWSMGLRPELRAGWMARAALQVETSGKPNDAFRWICGHCDTVCGHDSEVCLGCEQPRFPMLAAKRALETTVPPVTREVWIAWSDNDGGWIAAIHGSSAKREDIEWRIEQQTKEYGGNRFGLRSIRATLHVAEPSALKASAPHIEKQEPLT